MKTEVTCIIVDDELQNQEVLAKMLDQFCHSVSLLGTAENVDQAVELIKTKKPDVVFLDIEMPDGSGFNLFNYTDLPNFYTVFTTAHAEYAIKAIKFAAFDYLLKPINLTELKNAVERVAEKLRTGNSENVNNTNRAAVLRANQKNEKFEFNKIALSTPEGIEFFHVNEIVRCEADRAYCNFYLTGKRKAVISKSLKEYEDVLISANFFRVHKSFMINLAHVKRYLQGKGGFVELSDDSLIPVAVRKKEEFLRKLKAQNITVELAD